MRWNVEGADATTGRDRLVTVEAEDKQQAEVAARMKGLLVSAVHPVKILSPADKLDQMMSGKLDASTITSTHINEEMTDSAYIALTNAQPTPTEIPAPPPLEYRNTRGLNVQFAANRIAPQYVHLKIAGMLLAIFAGISYLVGVISFGLALLSFTGFAYIHSPAGMASSIIALLSTGAPVLVGAILHAFSALCFAMRDLSRNSFSR